MKKLVVVFLCFLASNAFASKPDSSIYPWKMPFTIIIQASGIEHDYGYEIGDTTYYTTHSLVITIPWYSFSAPDSMQFIDTSSSSNPGGSNSIQDFLEIDFAPKIDSILTLTYTSDMEGYETFQDESQSGIGDYSLKINSLNFDDTSIFSLNPGFLSHLISFTIYDSAQTTKIVDSKVLMYKVSPHPLSRSPEFSVLPRFPIPQQ